MGRSIKTDQEWCLSTKAPKADLTCFHLDFLRPVFSPEPEYYDVELAWKSVSICRLTCPMKHYWDDCVEGVSY